MCSRSSERSEHQQDRTRAERAQPRLSKSERQRATVAEGRGAEVIEPVNNGVAESQPETGERAEARTERAERASVPDSREAGQAQRCAMRAPASIDRAERKRGGEWRSGHRCARGGGAAMG